jgi:serine/threonine protein kinase
MIPFDEYSFRVNISIFEKAALVVRALHGLGLAHNNLRPENFVVMLQIQSGFFGQVRLRNFEYVQDVGQEYTKLGYDENNAPELEKYKEGDRIVSSQKVDVYQLSLCLFYLLGFKKREINNITREKVEQKAAERKVKEEHMRQTVDVLTTLLQTNLSRDPKERQTVDQIVDSIQSIQK